MTPHRQLLQGFSSDNTSITTASGDKLTSLGKGSVVLAGTSVGDGQKVELRDVLYVPDLQYNLLSTARMIDRGAKIDFMERNAVVWKDDKQVLNAVRIGDIYVLNSQDTALSAVTTTTWHKRFGHPSQSLIKDMQKRGAVTGMIFTEDSPGDEPCEVCISSKQTRASHPRNPQRASRPLEIIHMDVIGPMETTSLGGSRYLITFLDDHSGLSVVRPLKAKSEAPSVVKEVLNLLSTQTGLQVQNIRSDQGTEFFNQELKQYLTTKGIYHQFAAAYTPEQNGRAERLNRTIIEKTRALLLSSEAPKNLWAEAAATASYLRNRQTNSVNPNKTLLEVMFGKKPNVSHLRIFGSKRFVKVQKAKKLDRKEQKKVGMLVGYCSDSRYRVWIPDEIKWSFQPMLSSRLVSNLRSRKTHRQGSFELRLL